MRFVLSLLLIVSTAVHAGEQEVPLSYFVDGLEEVNTCLEEIKPSYEGTHLQVEDYQFTHDTIKQCMQLLQKYDDEFYPLLEASCSESSVEELPVQEVRRSSSLEQTLMQFTQSASVPKKTPSEATCTQVRHLYSKFASLHADMQELLFYSLRWLRVLKPEQYPTPHTE